MFLNVFTEILNILDNYKDAENLYLENYENIGFRNLNALKENGITIKESELGIKVRVSISFSGTNEAITIQ